MYEVETNSNHAERDAKKDEWIASTLRLEVKVIAIELTWCLSTHPQPSKPFAPSFQGMLCQFYGKNTLKAQSHSIITLLKSLQYVKIFVPVTIIECRDCPIHFDDCVIEGLAHSPTAQP